MPSRDELVVRASALNLDHTLPKYANDSVLEQAVINGFQNLTGVVGTATTLTPPEINKSRLSGGKAV